MPSLRHTVVSRDSFEAVAAASPEGVVLVGDPAGGGYALTLAEALRDQGGAQPEQMVLIAPDALRHP
jgi:acetyl esterase/lipase